MLGLSQGSSCSPWNFQICAQCGWKSSSEERPTEGREGWPQWWGGRGSGGWGATAFLRVAVLSPGPAPQQTRAKEIQSYYINLHFSDFKAAVKFAL